MIPMEELEGRMNASAHRVLVQSAADAAFNTLRVWGGGMFLPDEWYEVRAVVDVVVVALVVVVLLLHLAMAPPSLFGRRATSSV